MKATVSPPLHFEFDRSLLFPALCTPGSMILNQALGYDTSQWLSLFSSFYSELATLSLSIVQSLSCVWLFGTPWTAAHQASLSFTISRNLFKFMPIESLIVSNHLILCCSPFAEGKDLPNLKKSKSPAVSKWEMEREELGFFLAVFIYSRETIR